MAEEAAFLIDLRGMIQNLLTAPLWSNLITYFTARSFKPLGRWDGSTEKAECSDSSFESELELTHKHQVLRSKKANPLARLFC